MPALPQLAIVSLVITTTAGAPLANLTVVIKDQLTGNPVRLYANAAGTISISNVGQTVTDANGNLNCYCVSGRQVEITGYYAGGGIAYTDTVLPGTANQGNSVASIARTAAQLLSTPLASDIAAGPGALFYDLNNQALIYRINSAGTQYVPFIAASTPLFTNTAPTFRLDNSTHDSAMIWLDFDEASGSTTITDKRSAIVGTLQGANPTNAWMHAPGYTGNGTDQYVPLTTGGATGGQAGSIGGVTSLSQDIGNLSTLVSDGSMLLFVALLEHPSTLPASGCLVSFGLSIDDTGAANHLGGWAIYLTAAGVLQFQVKSPGASAGAIQTYTAYFDGVAGHGAGTNTRTAVACEIRASTVPGYLEMWSYMITINNPGIVLQQNNGAITFPILSGGMLTTTGWTVNTPGTYAAVPTVSVPAPATPQGVQARVRVRLNNSGGIDYVYVDEPGSGYTTAQMPLTCTITNAVGDLSAGGGNISLSSSLVGGTVTGPTTSNVTSPFTVGAWFGHNVSTPFAGSYLANGVTIQKLGIARVPNQYCLGYQACMNLRDNPNARPAVLSY